MPGAIILSLGHARNAGHVPLHEVGSLLTRLLIFIEAPK
jgi:hypothetical protein